MHKHRKNNWRRWFIVGIATAFALAVPTTALTASYLSPAEQVSDNIQLGGCVIRFDILNAAGTRVVPRIHANSVHRCVGVTGISVTDSGSLRVDFDTDASAVVSMLVGADETFARKDISCGPSVAVGYESIVCYRDGSLIRADSKTLYSHTANLWLIMTWWSGP